METQTKKKKISAILSVLLLLLIIGAALAVYWHRQGRLELKGRVRTAYTVVSAGSEGRVSKVAVNPGDRVTRGQALVLFDEQARRKALVEAREQLTLFAQMLPTKYRPAPGGDGDETLDQRHERRLRDEGEAERRLQEASDREAEASVYYSRVAMMTARREASEADRAAAEAHLAQARAEKERAKEDFEAVSLSRAASSSDLRRVRDSQRATGAAELPEDVRLERYRQQEEKVRIALLALEQAHVRAPADGLVAEVLTMPGQEVRPGAPLVLLRSEGETSSIVARATRGERAGLKRGMRCLVRLDGGESELEGYVASLRPDGADGAEEAFRVDVALLPGGRQPGISYAAEAAGLDAEITVLLREPLYATVLDGEDSATGLPPEASPVPAGEAAAPAAPVSVQTPFGAESEPEREQTAPESSSIGRGAPVLPPLEAPYPLKGSPLPDPANNPSVVNEEILENAAEAPR